MASRFSVVFITVPMGRAARTLSTALLKRRLAACVNIIPSIGSHYWWKGKLESAQEALLIVKTRASLVPKLIKEIPRFHPYSVPEIIALPIAKGFPPYLKWIETETKDK